MSGPAALPLFERRQLGARARIRVLLGAYGVVVAFFGIAWWSSDLPTSQMYLQQTRQTALASAQAVIDAGGPPLVGSYVPYRQALKDPAQFYPANKGDDPGVYLYLPVFGHVTGDTDPLSQLKWLFIGLMAIVLLVYPLVFYELFGSRAVALAMPFIVLFGFRFIQNQDIYVIEGWVILLCVPLLMLAAQGVWRRRFGLALVGVASLAASFANSIRGHSGTGIVLAALAVVLLRERAWRGRLAGVALVLAAYVLIFPLGFKAITTYSYHHVHMPNENLIAGHPLWHSMYIGLGYLPNRWGLQWNDSIAANAVTKVDPSAGYLSPRYEHDLRHLYFGIVEDDPGYVAKVYAVKGANDLSKVARHFWLFYFALPFVLVAGRHRDKIRRGVALALPATLLGIVPPVLTLPDFYDMGFLTGAVFIAVLAAIGVFLAARDWRAEHPEFDLHTWFNDAPAVDSIAATRAWLRRLRWRGSPGLALGAVVLLVVLGAVSVAATTATATEVWYQRRASILQGTPASTLVHRWSGSDMFNGWTPASGVAVNGGSVTTTPQSNAIQLFSPGIKLGPGTYAVVASGQPTQGGIRVGATTTKDQQWLTGAYYWNRQVGWDAQRMLAEFTLTAPTLTSVALANWNEHDAASAWSLRSLELRKLPSA